MVRKFIKTYNLKKNDKVLDVGCAKGYLVYDFHQAGIDAYGVDISKYALSKCPKKISNKV